MVGGLVSVTSADGTVLGARVAGDGPPLVLVHGTAASKECWDPARPLLHQQHTVWTYDRRGRGESGDAAAYAFEREVEDVVAVASAAGNRVSLFGHSFGGACALTAATELDGLRSLILYEVPIHIARRSDAIRRAILCSDAGDLDDALLIFLGEAAGLSDGEIAAAQSVPDLWDRFRDATPTCARELQALASRGWSQAQYVSPKIPTLYLTGERTDTPVYASDEDIRGLIPHAQQAVLAGQRHIAFATDPDQFARVVLDFTTRSAGPS